MNTFENATVVKQTGNRYLLCWLPIWDPFPAMLRGKWRLTKDKLTNPLAVGDQVDGYFQAEGEAVITNIHPRCNYLIRKSANLSKEAHIIAANLDQAYLVLSSDTPETPLPFIDRFLVTCQAYRVPVTLLLNKADLADIPPASRDTMPTRARGLASIYEKAGYRILLVSAKTGFHIETLKAELKGRISLFSGLSGVGKSSLANALDPTLKLKTAPLSEAHATGRHTTTFYEMHPLREGGYLIDSPGIKGFGLLDMQKEELYHYYPEIFNAAQSCKYNPCLHNSEPHCAVKRAVEQGLIAPERYESYLKLLLEDEGKYR